MPPARSAIITAPALTRSAACLFLSGLADHDCPVSTLAAAECPDCLVVMQGRVDNLALKSRHRLQRNGIPGCPDFLGHLGRHGNQGPPTPLQISRHIHEHLHINAFTTIDHTLHDRGKRRQGGTPPSNEYSTRALVSLEIKFIAMLLGLDLNIHPHHFDNPDEEFTGTLKRLRRQYAPDFEGHLDPGHAGSHAEEPLAALGKNLDIHLVLTASQLAKRRFHRLFYCCSLCFN